MPAGSCRYSSGFTLVEVLIAMVILAVGLLGLTALGVNAVHSVALGERNSRISVTATAAVEDALEKLRGGEVPVQLCTTLASGDEVSRTVVLSSAEGGGPPRLARVTVRVTPRGQVTHPFEMSGYYFDADGYTQAVAGSPCP